MNGIHDVGGMDGFGAVVVEPNEPVFHHAWEGRVFALASLALGRGLATADAFRHAIERLPPTAYLGSSYYARWLAAVERLVVEGGVATPAEVRAGRAATTAPVALPGGAIAALRHVDRPPRFAVGERVRARNVHPVGHTRLPRYARGRRGTIALVHPAWVFPDTNAHGLGENPEHVYAVCFTARELWGDEADGHATVHVDLFESYLEHG